MSCPRDVENGDPRRQEAAERANRAAPERARTRRALNNRLAPGIRGARHSRSARWRAFDQLPASVADAIRDSRSKLCPVAALRLVNSSNCPSEQIAHFLRRHAAWTDWRVLAADFGEETATYLRPDAPKRRPKLRGGRAP